MAARPGRVPSLDGMRAVSILVVLANHFVSGKIPGGLGVYIFFVISGFLITRLLLSEHKANNRISISKFYARRALRLYPVVIVYVAVVCLVYLVRRLTIDWSQPLSVLFYFTNYRYALAEPNHIASYHFMPFAHLWSLSVEEHFYFILPVVILWMRTKPKALLALMAGVCVACLLYRCGVASVRPALLETDFFYFRTECRLDSLAFGVALAAAFELAPLRRFFLKIASPMTLGVCFLAVLGCSIYRDPFFRETSRYSILGMAIVVAMASILLRGGWIARVLNAPPFVFVGVISYSLYVWHMCAHPIVDPLPFVHGAIKVLLLFSITGAIGCASYFLMERPLLRLRHRFGGGYPGPLSGTGAAQRGDAGEATRDSRLTPTPWPIIPDALVDGEGGNSGHPDLGRDDGP